MAKPEDGLGVLLAMGKPKAGSAESDSDEGSARELAAKSLISAIKAGDAAGVGDAFEELMHCCGGGGMGEDMDAE